MSNINIMQLKNEVSKIIFPFCEQMINESVRYLSRYVFESDNEEKIIKLKAALLCDCTEEILIRILGQDYRTKDIIEK